METIVETHTTTQKVHDLIASDRVEGTPLRRANGEMIGRIQRLMIDKQSGNVAYVVLTRGGFLRVGRKHLAIPWERLSYNCALGAYQLELTDDELNRARSCTANQELDCGDRNDAVACHRRRLLQGPE
jgi:sporulation protein YlmC with PRC-barrel domain